MEPKEWTIEDVRAGFVLMNEDNKPLARDGKPGAVCSFKRGAGPRIVPIQCALQILRAAYPDTRFNPIGDGNVRQIDPRKVAKR